MISAESIFRRVRRAYRRGLGVGALAQLSLRLVLIKVALREKLEREEAEEAREEIRRQIKRLEDLERWIAVAYRALWFRREVRAPSVGFLPTRPRGGSAWQPY